MKVFQWALILSVSFFVPSRCFTDTAPLYYSKHFEGHLDYIVKSSDIAKEIDSISHDICSKEDSKLKIYRVKNLLKSSPSGDGTYIKHVHYNTANDLDLPFSSSCDGKAIEYLNFDSDSNDSNKLIKIIDVEDENSHSIDEFISQSDNEHVIVQGKPLFHKPGTRVENLKDYVEEGIFDNLNLELNLGRPSANRRSDISDNEEAARISSEVEEDFKIAQSLVAEGKGDSIVTVMDNANTAEPLISPTNVSNDNSNLFTNYQFFTPALWMCLVVTSFLIFVFFTALSWISNIEISYKSFDKEIDIDKKNE